MYFFWIQSQLIISYKDGKINANESTISTVCKASELGYKSGALQRPGVLNFPQKKNPLPMK